MKEVLTIRFRFLLFAVIIFLADACNKPVSDLEKALQQAGSNRAPLEKVINHYSQSLSDSLKLRAAEFLIINMPVHLDDRLIITYEYLIDNIDRAFNDWQNGNWAKHIGFDDFCEYLLPYKVCEDQMLDEWREYFSENDFGNLHKLSLTAADHSAYFAAKNINKSLAAIIPKNTVKTNLPPFRKLDSLLYSAEEKNCEDYSILAAAAFRANGVPTAIDFTPQWANSEHGHVWCVIIDNSGNSIASDLNPPEIGFIFTREISKIYRRTYAINPELKVLKESGEKIPALFKNLCFKDVTDLYQTTSNISIPIEKCKNKFAYLCTFNNQVWNPIAFGKVKNDKVYFDKVGRDVLYIVAIMDDNKDLKIVSQPFILNLKGELEIMETPSAPENQTLRLYRKYPAQRFNIQYSDYIVGSSFQASNRPDFKDAETIHTINKYGTESDEIHLNPPQKFRYWRHLSAPNGLGSIAEILFFGNGENITSHGKIIGIRGKQRTELPEIVFDNDPASYYKAPSPSDCWTGLDFGSPTSIDRIIYAPRADGNGVFWGDEYELKYWKNNEWLSFGKKTADNIFVEFDNCPAGALFLLHNCTRGLEERPFLWKKGKVEWW